jgi:hypothetical protein
MKSLLTFIALLHGLNAEAQFGSFQDLAYMAQASTGGGIAANIQSFWLLDEPIQSGTHKHWADAGPQNNILVSANTRDTGPAEGIADKAEFLPAADTGQGCFLQTNLNSVNAGSGRSISMQIWMRLYDFLPAGPYPVIAKWHATGDGGTSADQDYILYFQPQGFVFSVRNLATSVVTVTNTSLGPLALKTWYHCVAGYDDALQQIWIQCSRQTNAVGARDSTACVGVQATTVLFGLGNYTTTSAQGTGLSLYRIDMDNVGFWQRSLSLSDVTNLYADSASWTYPFTQTAGQQLAARWAGAVVNAGGAAVGSATTNAMAYLNDAFIATNIMHKQYSYCLFVPDNLTAALMPGRAPTYSVHYENGSYPERGSQPYANSGSFVGGDVTINGLNGNGSTKYLDTGVLPTVCSSDSGGLSLYVYNNTVESRAEFVSQWAPSNELGLYANRSGGDGYFACWTEAGNGLITASGTANFQGFYTASRTSASLSTMYYANSGQAFISIGVSSGTTSVSTVGGNRTLYLFAANSDGTATSFSSKTLSYSSVHQGFSTAEGLGEYGAVQGARVIIGGGFR